MATAKRATTKTKTETETKAETEPKPPESDEAVSASSDETSTGKETEPEPIDSQTVEPEPPPRRTSSSRPRRRTRQQNLADRLEQALGAQMATPDGRPYVTGLAGLVAIVEPYDAQVMVMNSRQVAEAWANLAEEDERVRRALERMLMGGAWSAAILATFGMLAPIMIHHGIVPKKLLQRQPVSAEENGKPEQE